MKILHRYILKGFAGLFLIAITALSSIYLIVDLFEKMDDFLEAGAPILDSISYFVLKIPGIMFKLFPMAVLLAGLLFFSLLMRHGEYLALRGIGIAPKKILRPVLVGTLLLSVLVSFIHGTIVQSANLKAKRIWNQEVERIPALGSSSGIFFYRGKGTIWAFERGEVKTLLKNVNLILFDQQYSCNTIYRASEARFDGKDWTLIHGFEEDCNALKAIAVHFFTKKAINIEDTPEDLSSITQEPKEMGVFRLASLILRLKRIGLNDQAIDAIFWDRVFYPFLGVSLLFFGLKVLFWAERGGLGLGFSIGLGVGFAGWALWNLLCSWGETGKITPVLPPLIVIGTFFGIGLALDRWRKYHEKG